MNFMFSISTFCIIHFGVAYSNFSTLLKIFRSGNLYVLKGLIETYFALNQAFKFAFIKSETMPHLFTW